MKLGYARVSTDEQSLTKRLADCLESIILMQDCLLGIEENARRYRRLLREGKQLVKLARGAK